VFLLEHIEVGIVPCFRDENVDPGTELSAVKGFNRFVGMRRWGIISFKCHIFFFLVSFHVGNWRMGLLEGLKGWLDVLLKWFHICRRQVIREL